MKTVEEWKAHLRARLRLALSARDQPVLTVLREALAAIENAEAPPASSWAAPSPVAGGVFAGSAGSIGAGEVERRVLSPAAVLAIIEREIGERREAAAEFMRLGRAEEAEALSLQADVLAEVAAEGEG